MPSEEKQDNTVFMPQESTTVSAPPHPLQKDKGEPAANPLWFHAEEDPLDLPLIDDQADQDSPHAPFVLPFQNSAAMPTIAQRGEAPVQGAAPSLPAGGKPRQRSLHAVKWLLIGCVVFITIIGASLFVFAQPATPSGPPQGSAPSSSGTPGTAHPQQPTGSPQKTTPISAGIPTAPASSPLTPSSHNAPIQGPTPGTGTPTTNDLPTPQQLSQLGWTQAGLSLGDAFEALRTGTTFTDREMSYDYRAIGIPMHHSGTLTGSTFLLTPGGQVRFAHNDVRAINNVLYDMIRTTQIIQQVVHAQPTLVQFQTVSIQGQPQLFAWVTVSFELFQSKVDLASGNRMEDLERDATTGQPIVHHLDVVLVRVSLQNQGANAPMGGTGWLVDTYEQTTGVLPTIATDPTL